MTSKYEPMLKDAQTRLNAIDKERNALVALIDSLLDLISIEKGEPEIHITTPDAPVVEMRLSPQTTPLIDMAVAVLRKHGSPMRGIDLLKTINGNAGREYDYSSLAKALSREAESKKSRVVKNPDKTWSLTDAATPLLVRFGTEE